MGKFFEQAMSLFGDNKNKSSHKNGADAVLHNLWQKARYRFEFEASVSDEDGRDFVLRLQGISDFPLVQVLRKAGVDLSRATVSRCYSIVEDSRTKELHCRSPRLSYF